MKIPVLSFIWLYSNPHAKPNKAQYWNFHRWFGNKTHRAAWLGSPHPGPPPRPCFVPRRFQGQYARPGHGRARTPQFLLSRQRTRCCQCCRLRLAQRRLKSLCVFCITVCYLLNPPPLGEGARKKTRSGCFAVFRFSHGGGQAKACGSCLSQVQLAALKRGDKSTVGIY